MHCTRCVLMPGQDSLRASPAQMGDAGASCFPGGKEIGPGNPHLGESSLDEMRNAGASCFPGGKEIGSGIPHLGESSLEI